MTRRLYVVQEYSFKFGGGRLALCWALTEHGAEETNLAQLLREGWLPVRETAHEGAWLILLEHVGSPKARGAAGDEL